MSLDRMQKSRIAAAGSLMRAFSEYSGRVSHDEMARILVSTYIRTGKGEEVDVMSTIVDAISDLGFTWVRNGLNFKEAVDDAKSGEPTTMRGELLLALRPAYGPGAAGYRDTHNFDDILRMASEHVGIESVDGDADDYEPRGPRGR